jgi:hypothetical protein
MRVIDLINLLKANVIYTYYPNAFPASAADDCAVVTVTGGGTPNILIGRPSAQVLIRAKVPAMAEAKAWEIYGFLNQKTNFTVGTVTVVYCTAEQSAPMFIGNDENNRTVYSLNFSFITDL